jgi:thiol-disulfide isomerase/thioredoxin
MKRHLRLVIALIATQAAVFGVYWLVEQQRTPERSEGTTLGTAPPERVDAPMTPLALRRPDGSRMDFRRPERLTLLHFWATWCPPCRAELPGLLGLPKEHPVDVMAVALDKDWAEVEGFLDGLKGSSVLLGEAADAERTLGVRSLPVSFLVRPNGRIAFRFDGARDWTDTVFLKTWIKDIEAQ